MSERLHQEKENWQENGNPNEFLEGFTTWNPENEEREECFERLKQHIFRVMRDRNLFTCITEMPFNEFDHNAVMNHGVFDDITATKFTGLNKSDRQKEREKLGEKIRDVFDFALDSMNTQPTEHRFNEDHRKETEKKIRNSLYVNHLKYTHGDTDESKTNYFQGTSTNDREFFYKDRDLGYRMVDVAERTSRGLAGGLFRLPVVTKRGMEYLKSNIDGKRIALIGGGASIDDLLHDSRLKPKKVINIDPFIKEEHVDRNKDTTYESFNISALDPQLAEKLKEESEVDEIWCTHSIPHYIESPEDFGVFFNNIKKLLAPGGICRIYPVLLYGMKDWDESKNEQRKQIFLAEINKIIGDENFNVAICSSIFNEQNTRHQYRAGDNALLTLRRLS